MRVLLDTNVLLDYYLERSPFFQDALELIKAHQAGKFRRYVAAITPINIYYVARKLKGQKQARITVELLLSTFRALPINQAVLSSALNLPIPDYEDAVQAYSASLLRLNAIVTRDSKDFQHAPISVYTPSAFLQTL